MKMQSLYEISHRLLTQDNQCTSNPMFCVQVKVRDTGYDSKYSDPDELCWYSAEQSEVVFEEPADIDGWEEFGFKDRWETVMVTLTEEGAKGYIERNGHNHRGEKRIFIESFNRCEEMISLRTALMELKALTQTGGEG